MITNSAKSPDRSELRHRLVNAGLKATHQRIVVYEAMLSLHGNHPSAEMVYQQLKPANPSISLGTVYKTLDSLVECKLLRRVLTDDTNRRYDDNSQPHGHLYCANTREILDFHDPELDQLLQDFFRKKQIENFDISSVSVQITGVKQNPEQNIRIE